MNAATQSVFAGDVVLFSGCKLKVLSAFRHLTTRICSIQSCAFRETCVRSLVKVLHVTFAPLRELMACYNHHSKSIYGDSGHIKIAITNDSSWIEMKKMRNNAVQVQFNCVTQSIFGQWE